MKKQRRQSPRYQREAEQARIAAEAAARKRVPCDPTQMVIPANSYFTPPAFYEDVAFKCRGCGMREVWSAEDQQWWYEVAKGPIYATAVLCLACRKAKRAAHGGTPMRLLTQQRERSTESDAADEQNKGVKVNQRCQE